MPFDRRLLVELEPALASLEAVGRSEREPDAAGGDRERAARADAAVGPRRADRAEGQTMARRFVGRVSAAARAGRGAARRAAARPARRRARAGAMARAGRDATDDEAEPTARRSAPGGGAVAGRLLPAAAAPPLDEVSCGSGAALHDLLALAHPDLAGPGPRAAGRSGSRRRRWRWPRSGRRASAREAVNRHSLLARLPEIVRVDRTVQVLARAADLRRADARPADHGAAVAAPGAGRARAAASWLREIGIPAVGRRAFLALNVASPLGEALDPLRLDPPLGWGRDPAGAALSRPLARAVAGAAVELGVERAGDALAGALYRYAWMHDPPVGVPATRRERRLRAPVPGASGVARRPLRRGSRRGRAPREPAGLAGAGARAGGGDHRGGAHPPVAGLARGRPAPTATSGGPSPRGWRRSTRARRRPARRGWRRRSPSPTSPPPPSRDPSRYDGRPMSTSASEPLPSVAARARRRGPAHRPQAARGRARARRALPRQGGAHPAAAGHAGRRRAHADRRAARHRQVGAGAPPGAAHRRALLRVPADALLRAERDLRPGRHQGLPRGDLHAPRRGDAARRRDRLPRRDLQVELGDLELAAQHPERAAVLHRRGQHQGAAVLALRRDERGPQRRRAGGDLRPLPGARLSENLDSFHFHGLVERGMRGEMAALAARRASRAAGAAAGHAGRDPHAAGAPGAAAAVPRGVPGALQGAHLPDPLRGRDALRPPRRQAAQAVRGERAPRRAAGGQRRRLLRPAAHLEQRRSDRVCSRTSWGRCWSSTAASTPRSARPARGARDLDGILAELGVIRGLLLGGEPLSDVQLFSQLRNLQEIRAALQALGTDTAQAMAGEVDKLLEGVFESSKWSG